MTQIQIDTSLTLLTSFACELADAAAEITLKFFKSSLIVDNKLGNQGFDPVTVADQQAERAMRELIKARFPEHNISGEEFGVTDNGSDYEWCLDPIDGTKAFISGIPVWGTLIALRFQGDPIIGVIDQPYMRERYVGSPTGTTLNDTIIHIRKCSDLGHATLSTIDPNSFNPSESVVFDEILKQCNLVRYGLDCYAYAVMAAGHIDLVIESGMQSYDMMALIPVIKGAGGYVTNWEGEKPGNCGRLVATGDAAVHAAALGILSRHSNTHAENPVNHRPKAR